MRILRLDLGRTIGTLDLHPFVTVVSDLNRDQGDAMAEAIRSIVRGSSAGFGGLVENRGELLELGGGDDTRLNILTTDDIIFGLNELVGTPASIASLEAERDQLRRKADLDAVFVEQVRADLDPTSAAQIHRLRQILSGERAVVVDEAQQAQANEIQELLAVVDETPPTITDMPAPIAELIAKWEAYVGKRDQAKRHLSLLNDRVGACEASLSEAMETKAIAEAAAVPVLLSKDDDARLEELANPGSKTGRRRRKKADLAAAEEEIAALLALAQQPSYTAYVMHRVNPAPPPEKLDAVVAADFAVERAEAALQEARAEIELDPVASELDYELHLLREASREHLGAVLPDDLGAGLSAVLNHEENPAWVDAVSTLGEALERAGVELDDDGQPGDIPTLAVDWLGDFAALADKALEFDPLEVSRDLEKAEQAFRRHVKSMTQIDRFEARSDESAKRCRDLTALIERLHVGSGTAADHLIGTLRPQFDQMFVDAGVPVPVIVWGDVEELSDDEAVQLYEGLEALSDRVQIIYVSDSERLTEWVDGAGLRRSMRSSVSSVRS